jgi:hypothetical protein
MINHRALVHQYLRKRVHESGYDSDRMRLALFELVYTRLKKIEERKVAPRNMFPLFNISTPIIDPEKFFLCIAMADRQLQYPANVYFSGRHCFKDLWLSTTRSQLDAFVSNHPTFDGHMTIIFGGSNITPPVFIEYAYGTCQEIVDKTEPVIPSTWQEVTQEFEKNASTYLLSVRCQILWQFEVISAVLYIQRAWRRWLDRKAWRRRNAICLKELLALPPGTFPTLTEWSVDVQAAKAHFESQQ